MGGITEIFHPWTRYTLSKQNFWANALFYKNVIKHLISPERTSSSFVPCVFLIHQNPLAELLKGKTFGHICFRSLRRVSGCQKWEAVCQQLWSRVGPVLAVSSATTNWPALAGGCGWVAAGMFLWLSPSSAVCSASLRRSQREAEASPSWALFLHLQGSVMGAKWLMSPENTALFLPPLWTTL